VLGNCLAAAIVARWEGYKMAPAGAPDFGLAR